MNETLTAVLITFLIVLGCLALLSIGLLLSGKSRMRLGQCGKDPTKKKEECDKDDDDSCGICGR